MKNRKKIAPNWYLDMSEIIKYWDGQQRVYHHTAPINMMYALYQSLYDLLDEGIDNAINRHYQVQLVLKDGLAELGLELLVKEEDRLPSLNAIKIPNGIDDLYIRKALLNEYDIEIGGGLGPFAGRVWRVGLMGHSAREKNVDKLISAFKDLI